MKFTVCTSKKRNNLGRRIKRSKKALSQFSQRVKVRIDVNDARVAIDST